MEFEKKMAKFGRRRIVTIPKVLQHQAEALDGKLVRVVIEEVGA